MYFSKLMLFGLNNQLHFAYILHMISKCNKTVDIIYTGRDRREADIRPEDVHTGICRIFP